MPRIKRPVGLVVSGGRTGTAFMGSNLSQILPGSISCHEPDAVHSDRLLHDIRSVRRVCGLRRGLFGKLLGLTGIRNISNRFLAGRIDATAASQAIMEHRANFYDRDPSQLFIESNYAFFGLLPVLPRTFENYRVIAITRNPEDWIRSYLKKADRYGKKDLLNKFGLRITPAFVGDKEAAQQWSGMSVPERLAWYWRLVYSRIAEADANDPNILTVRFEDLFQNENREEELYRVADFLGAIANPPIAPVSLSGLMDNVRNAAPPAGTIASDQEIKRAVSQWCQPLSSELGY